MAPVRPLPTLSPWSESVCNASVSCPSAGNHVERQQTHLVNSPFRPVADGRNLDWKRLKCGPKRRLPQGLVRRSCASVVEVGNLHRRTPNARRPIQPHRSFRNPSDGASVSVRESQSRRDRDGGGNHPQTVDGVQLPNCSSRIWITSSDRLDVFPSPGRPR